MLKKDTFIDQTLKILSFNSDNHHHRSSTIHVCCYLTEDYEDEFKAAAGYSGLKFSSQISAVEIGSMMSDVGLNISQLRILLRIFNFILLLEIDSEIARKTDPYFDQSALHRYILFKMLSLSKDF